jgi:hypothetical protein
MSSSIDAGGALSIGLLFRVHLLLCAAYSQRGWSPLTKVRTFMEIFIDSLAVGPDSATGELRGIRVARMVRATSKQETRHD